MVSSSSCNEDIFGADIITYIKKHRKNRKTLPREQLFGCQGVKMFLLKDPFKKFFINRDLSYFNFCHNLNRVFFFSQYEF